MRRTPALTVLTVLALVPLGVPQATASPTARQENVRFITNVPGATGGHVVAEGDRLYVGAYGLGMTIYDISNPARPVMIGEYKPGPSGSDPGLRADAVPDAAVFNGRHIAALNGTSRAPSTQQTEFLDVTDPAAPVLLHRFTGGADGEAHNGDIVDARGLWLPSGGSGGNGLRIYDLSPLLANPPQAPKRLFAGNPGTLWNQSPYRRGRSVGSFGHVHDIEVYTDYSVLLPAAQWVDQDGDGIPDETFALRDIALLAAPTGYSVGAASNTGGTYVVDITDPTKPVVLNRWQNPTGSGSTPIRYNHEAQFLQGDPHILVMTDEDIHSGCNFGRMYVARVSEDLTEATKLSEWAIGADVSPSPLCGSHVYSSNGHYVFMGAYHAGLQVVDLSDPAAPKRAGQYVAEGANSWGGLYYRGYVYVGDFGPRGLDVFHFVANPVAKGMVKVQNPALTQVAGVTETLGNCDPASPANGVDGWIVRLPEGTGDGFHWLRAMGGSEAPYDLNVYWYDTSCAFMSGVSLNSPNPDEFGPIPEGAGTGVIGLVTGAPQWVYAQVEQAPPEEPLPPAPEANAAR